MPISEIQAHLVKPQETRKATISAVYLGICTLVMFVAFKPAQNLISRLFHNLGYEFLGKISLISLYLLFGLFSIITP